MYTPSPYTPPPLPPAYSAKLPSQASANAPPPAPPPTAKLREFNQRTGDGSHRLEESVLQELTKLAEPEGTPAPHHLATLLRLLDWPKGEVDVAIKLLLLIGWAESMAA